MTNESNCQYYGKYNGAGAFQLMVMLINCLLYTSSTGTPYMTYVTDDGKLADLFSSSFAEISSLKDRAVSYTHLIASF